MAYVNRRKKNLSPINNMETESETQTPQDNVVLGDEVSESSTIDEYLKESTNEEGGNLGDYRKMELEVENEELRNKISVLTSELTGMKSKLEFLMKENEKLKLDGNSEANETKIKSLEDNVFKLQDENDTFLLKNSELEYEVARLTETLKKVQGKYDSKLHTYTPNSYTRKNGFVGSMNGYQDWR